MLSSDLYVKAFENARQGLLLIETPSGRILEANAAFLRMCRRGHPDVAGRNFWRPPMVADAEAGAEIFEQLRSGGSLSGAELPLLQPDGRCLIMDVNGKDLGGGVMQLEVQDASARESARVAERMDAQRTLARRVAAEFNELHESLQSAGRMLANSARRGNSAFTESDEIRDAAERAGNIVRELRAYGEELPLENCPVQLNELIESMRPLLRRVLGSDIRIDLKLGEDVPAVLADPVQFRQVLLKLAANSREAMEKGGVFRIGTGNAAADDPALAGASGKTGYSVVTVSDDGPGLDDESWAHLYEPFFTTKTTGKRGLGLAAVHGIVRQSGGRIWADSEPGRGTSFRIYLPQTALEPAAATAADRTILVVEENDGLRAVVTSLLTRHGYHVLAAAEPQDSWEFEKRQGACTLILNGGSNHSTGKTAPGTITLNKPFELDKLLQTVRELVRQ